MNRQFWRSKRVFITRHTGFKGGWLVLWLANLATTSVQQIQGYVVAAEQT